MNIPETQKDLLAYLDRITRELGSTRGGRIQNRLDHFTTASITDSLAISRSLASQYLNELVRAGLVVKAGARPVCYFHRRSLERFFQSRIERSTYPSVEQLFATLGNGERLDFDRAIGHELSLAPCISQLCAALKYPPAGLPILLCGASGTGKGLLAELALEYGKNVGVLQQEAKLVSIDCSHYADDARALTHDLCADGGPADRAAASFISRTSTPSHPLPRTRSWSGPPHRRAPLCQPLLCALSLPPQTRQTVPSAAASRVASPCPPRCRLCASAPRRSVRN